MPKDIYKTPYLESLKFIISCYYGKCSNATECSFFFFFKDLFYSCVSVLLVCTCVPRAFGG